MVIKAFGAFNGEIIQVPPKYSALKVDGRRLYDYARKGEDVEIKGRKTYIYSIEINNIDLTDGIINFDVSCSKGTYIRSICRDIGEILGCQGTMTKLARTATGAFKISDAMELDYFINSDIKELEEAIKPMDYPLDKLGKCVMEKEYAKRFINGQRIPLRNVVKIKNTDKIDKYAIYVDQIKSDNFLGVAIYENDRFCYKAEKVVGEINENI
jgi:tRNA pseudouridine55 synthase